MLEENFEKIYREFRLQLYKKIFKTTEESEGALTATEFFAVETIDLLGEPTVGEFAECLSITSPLAAYRVRQLIEKGYVIKVPTEDKRQYKLHVTAKFTEHYHSENSYGRFIFDILSKTLTEQELATTDKLFEKFVNTIENVKNR